MDRRPGVAAVLVAVAYYVGADLGFLLRLPPATTSVLWPPNTILTAALLMSPPRQWWIYLLAGLPGHLLAEIPVGLPLPLILTLFATNCSQALIGAAGVRWFSDAPARFDTLRRTTIFILAAGLAAPFFSSFPDAAAVALVRHESYGLVWRTRFFSNVLTELILGPAIVMAVTAGPAWIRHATRARKTEAVLLTAALILIGAWAFGVLLDNPGVMPGGTVVVFVLPLILLTTVWFGPAGASLSLLITSLMAIGGATHGRGPFSGLTAADTILSLQILLSALAIPVLCLGAVVVERRQAVRVLAEQLRLEALLSRLATAFVRLPSHEMDPAFQTALRQVGEAVGVEAVVLSCEVGCADRNTVHEWTATGSAGSFALTGDHFPWTLAQLHADRVVAFTYRADLPGAAARDAEAFGRAGVRSALIVPLMAGARVRGAISLLTTSRPRRLTGQAEWLRVVAEIFANALARKEAEDALRAGELLKSAILGSLSSAVAVLDRDGRIIDVNGSWARMTAGPDAEATAGLGVGVNLLEAWGETSEDDDLAPAPGVVPGIRRVLGSDGAGCVVEYPRRDGGRERWFVMSVVPLERPEGGAVVACTDVTERKRAELDAQRSRQELAHFTRVSTMGQLTASIAHELNQPLTGILTNARAGQRFLDAEPPDLAEVQAILSDIVADDKRAADVIQRLRDILRKTAPQRVELDLNALVQDVARLLGSDAIIRNVIVKLELAAEPVIVSGDRIELQQVVLNLLVNAMEALADHRGLDRTIVVATQSTELGAAHVSVRDSGPGLRAAGHDQVFEPFFTTKPAGMGMGLSIARSIIEAHGGIIWAIDDPRGGAAFHFVLPAPPEPE